MGKILALILISLLLAAFLSFVVSASTYYSEQYSTSGNNYDNWYYKEYVKKKIKTFSLVHVWSGPSYNYNVQSNDYGKNSWTSSKPLTINSQPPSNSYNALKQAFDSFNSRTGKSTYSYSGYQSNYW